MATPTPYLPGRRRRGRTRPGRLAFVDRFLCRAMLPSCEPPAVVLDVGVGEDAWTTAELRAALHAAGCAPRVIGIELDRDRVEAARQHFPELEIQHGDPLRDPVGAWPQGHIVRAMNVLRDLTPDAARAGHRRLGALLVPGGTLLEGNCSRDGSCGCLHVMRGRGDGPPHREGLVMYTSFTRGCGPFLFRDQLPRDLRHSCRPGHPIHQLLCAWHQAFEAERDCADPKQRFARSLHGLAQARPGVCLDPALLERGYFWYRPPDGVPEG